MHKILSATVLALLVAGSVRAANTEQVLDALTTLAAATEGRDQVNSFVAHFCLTTQKAIREGKRGWYTLAQADYTDLKAQLNSEDLSRFKDPFLAFERVFYHFDGN